MMALLYFALGIIFTSMAFTYAEETVFNPITIILLLVAALDFVIGFRYLKARKNKKINQAYGASSY